MMSDTELLIHCYNSLTGEYGEIANTLLVETLKLRLAKQEATEVKPIGLPEGYSIITVTQKSGKQVAAIEKPVSPAKLRSVTNSPWHHE